MTTTEIEINKELVASTGNISLETYKWLTSSDSDGIVASTSKSTDTGSTSRRTKRCSIRSIRRSGVSAEEN